MAACADPQSPQPDATGVDYYSPPPSDGLTIPSDVAPDVPAVDPGGEPDAGQDPGHDAGAPPPVYGHLPPPPGPVPEELRGDHWRQHFLQDVLPFWIMPEALGEPPGNYPTYRGMDGSLSSSTDRRPRMISRQIYTYSMGYLLTGQPQLLDYAQAGVDWLLAHALDAGYGGCHTLLDAAGNPLGDDPKTAQDTAYCALGLAAWFFVTRDPTAETALLGLRDLLRDPATFWDADNERIRDALSEDLAAEIDLEGDGGWELVAQLDAINAFMLLAQPVLTDAARRAEMLADLQTLSRTLVDHFHADGMFWGVHNKHGEYGSKHADFGHALKSFWMLLQVDKRLQEHPFRSLLEAELAPALERAWDSDYGRWAKRPTGADSVEYGSDWWIYAEADQLAATFHLHDHRFADRLASSWPNWHADYVDRTRPAREVVPGVDRDGSWVWSWTDGDTAKCNHWKNGFHSTEHALVGYLLGRYLEDLPAALYFAPLADPDGFVAVPYVFTGDEASRESLGTTEVGGETLTRVRVEFVKLR